VLLVIIMESKNCVATSLKQPMPFKKSGRGVNKGGRPLIGDEAMTSAERVRKFWKNLPAEKRRSIYDRRNIKNRERKENEKSKGTY
jgi:hypothetical protein